MNYVILDFEWNQAASKSETITAPIRLNGEIIQIGAVKTDENFKLTDKFDAYISPRFYTVMNRHVQKITGISGELLSLGEPFADVYKKFINWCGNEFGFITWGYDDIPMLVSNLIIHGIDPPVFKHYNLQLIFKNQADNSREQWSLSDAVAKLGIEANAEAHDALNDAVFTYKICEKLDMEKGIAEYSSMKTERREAIETKVFQIMGKRRTNLESEGITSVKCPLCGLPLVLREWIYFDNRKQSTLGFCAEHGEFLIKIRSEKNLENRNIIRVIYRSDERARAAYNKNIKRKRALIFKEQNRGDKEILYRNDNNSNV